MSRENTQSQIVCIPEPRFKLPILGHMHYLKQDMFGALLDLSSKLGPIYRLKLGSKDVVFVCTFELIKELCDESRFEKSIGPIMEFLKSHYFKENIALIETGDPLWGKYHRILLPGFKQQALHKDYFPAILDVLEGLFKKWDYGKEKEINIIDDLSKTVFDIIGICGFNYRFNSLVSEKKIPFLQAMEETIDYLVNRFLFPDYLLKLEFQRYRKFQEGLSIIFKQVDEIFDERKKQSDSSHKVFLDYMLNDVDKITGEKLNDTQIRNQILGLFAAAHDTTTGLLGFAFNAVMTYPSVLEKAYAEVDRVLGADPSKPITAQDFVKLEYIPQILNECLRLWTPLLVLERSSLEDTVLGGRYPIKKGECISALIGVIHKDKTLWGEDADSFNPDRFAPELVAQRDPLAFLPFGIGRRSCIGSQFAMFVATVILGRTLQKYRLHKSPKSQVRITKTLVTQISHTLWVTLEKKTNEKPIIIPKQTEKEEKEQKEKEEKAPKEIEPTLAPMAEASTIPTDAKIRLLVAFGSNMGTCEGIARRIAKDGENLGFDVSLAELDNLAKNLLPDLPKVNAAILVACTYNGLPPDNAVNFANSLQNPEFDASAFKGLKFSVFGCGNTQWKSTYQDFPRLLQKSLLKIGGKEIYPIGEVDGNTGDEEAFEVWYRGFWPAISKEFSISDLTSIGKLDQEENLDLKLDLISHSNLVVSHKPRMAENMEVLINRELQTVSGAFAANKSTRHIELALQSGVHYTAGDYLVVHGQNDGTMVKQVLERFRVDPRTLVKIHPNQQTFFPVDQEIPVIDLLTRYVELHDISTRRHIKILAKHTPSPEKEKLSALLNDTAYKEEIHEAGLSTLDLLYKFPTCELSFVAYLSILPPLRPRYYSISSSSLASPTNCSLTVGTLNIPTKSGKVFNGMCSNYLARQGEGSYIKAHVANENKFFRLPENLSLPLIMVCAGTGFAPFRGFLQERNFMAQQGQTVGKSTLFFGIRHPEKDYLYKEELSDLSRNNIVAVHLAPSRIEGQPKCYVQDKLWEEKDLVWKLISEGAIIYVCGEGSRMAPAVQKSFERIYCHHTGNSAEDAEKWISKLSDTHQYRVDAWSFAPTIGSSA